MTQMPEEHKNAIELELTRVETIHVTTGSQKVASLCLILKDTPEVRVLIENPMPTPTMLIVDVVPVADDSNHADVFFRNLTADEILTRSRSLLSPNNLRDSLIETLFPSDFGVLTDDDLSINISKDNTKEKEDFSRALVEQVFPEGLEDLPQTAKDIFTNFIQHIEQANVPVVNPNQSLYKIRLTLAQAHLAQMLCVSTNAPAFALSSEAVYSPAEPNATAVWGDFIALLEFPYPDTPAYFDATALLIQSVTGRFPLSITLNEVNEIRAEIASTVVRIAKGSTRGLIETFPLINPTNKTFSRRERGERLDKNDALNIFKNDTINRLYDLTNPKTLISLLKGTPESAEEAADKANLENLLAGSGMDEVFQDVIDEVYENKVFKLSSLPTAEEVIAFYSTPISLSTLPDDLKIVFQKSLNMPIFYAHDWAKGMPDIEMTRTNVGEIAVSKLITIAVRLARLEEIARVNNDEKFIPMAVVFSGLNFPGEPAFWLYEEAINILVANGGAGDQNILFEQLVTAGFPVVSDDIPPQKFMETAFVTVLHLLGHRFASKWDRIALLNLIEDDNPTIAVLIQAIYEKIDEFSELEDYEEHKNACAVIQAIYEFFIRNQGLSPLLLAHELGNLITRAAAHVVKSTNPMLAETNPAEYVRALQSAARKLFED